MSESNALQSKVAIVTGASSGVGRATALALASRGVAVALIGRERTSLDEVSAAIGVDGGLALAAPADVADEDGIARAVAATIERFGGVDILVNAAGVGLYGPVAQYSLADWRTTLETNLTGVFVCSRAVLPAMQARGGGAIIAIGSGAGKQGYANLAAYSASKFGLLGFMQSLAAEVGEAGIKVSTILPGSIMTPFAGRSLEEKARQRAEGRKFLDPEDVANGVVYLLEQSDWAWTQELNLWPF